MLLHHTYPCCHTTRCSAKISLQFFMLPLYSQIYSEHRSVFALLLGLGEIRGLVGGINWRKIQGLLGQMVNAMHRGFQSPPEHIHVLWPQHFYKYTRYPRPAGNCRFHPLAFILSLVPSMPHFVCLAQHPFLVLISVRIPSSRGCFLHHAALFLSLSAIPSTFFFLVSWSWSSACRKLTYSWLAVI